MRLFSLKLTSGLTVNHMLGRKIAEFHAGFFPAPEGPPVYAFH